MVVVVLSLQRLLLSKEIGQRPDVLIPPETKVFQMLQLSWGPHARLSTLALLSVESIQRHAVYRIGAIWSVLQSKVDPSPRVGRQ